MASIEESVIEQFQCLGIEVENKVLAKCVNLCEEYNIDAETFTEQWMAFSLTNLNGASPTLENLDLLVRKEFSKQAVNRISTPASESIRASTGTSLTVYGAPISTNSDNEVLSNYISGTPKRVKLENEAAPAQQNELCPVSYSPNVGHSAKYASRHNQGAVVHSYGDDDLLKLLTTVNSATDILNFNITQVPNDDGEVLTKAILPELPDAVSALNDDLSSIKVWANSFGLLVNPTKSQAIIIGSHGMRHIRFGFELLHEKSSIFDNHIRYISQCIMKKQGITDSTSVRHKTQTEVCVAGRIECDADARLNPKCVVLQGTWEDSLSQAVPVDIDIVKQYSLFPGQVVVMRGLNPRGDRFIANEVYYDSANPPPSHSTDIMNTLQGNLSMVVVAGPYTTSDNMAYEPLKDLVSYINTSKPHVVIMTGPFLDTDHLKIKDNSMAETYKSFFDKLIDSLAELNNTSPFTKIYIVSSVKDAFHVNIFPTPPYSSRRKHPNITFMPDPSTLNINGVLVSVTSNDVLMQISQEEISMGVGGDKLSRVASHVFSQQCMFPLWPPGALPVDAALWAAHAQLTATPHLLILPSNFRYFVKNVNGCLVVNPEHLTKGAGGGTFARILLSSDNASLKLAAQIIRI